MTWPIVALTCWLTGLLAWAVRTAYTTRKTTKLVASLESNAAALQLILERQKVLELAVANALAQMVQATGYSEEKYRQLMTSKLQHKR